MIALAALLLLAQDGPPIPEEVDGLLAVEAEDYVRQSNDAVRRWHRVSAADVPSIEPDGDPPHLDGASGGAYLEILPDTRRTHDDRLVKGENFSDEPGMAVLEYRVRFRTPGRYYVWARVFSTGTEDNGLHAGIDGTWPESGKRMQWTAKNRWTWGSRQRTKENHGGVPGLLYLDVPTAGEHVIAFSMREDGFEFDRWMMTHAGRYGDGSVAIEGERKQWHKVTLSLRGPRAAETDADPNPFTDCRMTVTFTHESGKPSYAVPGYFAADGKAGETSAEAGDVWRAHLSPDLPGRWTYAIAFARGKNAAVGEAGEPLAPYDGLSGGFEVAPTDKTGADFRAKGRLQYVGGHHLRHAGTGEYFLKMGPDAPETFLACVDFDGTSTKKVPLKTWAPHAADWAPGDPTWKDGKGKGMIGALNYLASKGCNVFSFLPYNAGGDGDNVWPFAEYGKKLHYDCSKLDQWGVVFDHAQAKGLYLHFKLQETEMDDNRKGKSTDPIPQALDGGDLGIERKLYCRELIARFGHALALNWNLGEENTQTPEQQRAMAKYILDVDPYDHHLVIHTFPNEQDKVYPPLLGDRSVLTGASLQNGWNEVHRRTLQWIQASAEAGRKWVVANDEQGSANLGVPPDPSYPGMEGKDKDKKGKPVPTIHEIRHRTLWGNLMAGGAGVEYYFGYELPQNDLLCEDFRSRDRSWDYGRHALAFFRALPFWEMENANALVGNAKNADDLPYALAKAGGAYAVYLPKGGTAELDLSGVEGAFTVEWYSPREGGAFLKGSVAAVQGGAKVSLGDPPSAPDQDWAVKLSRSQ